jgi:hypothetical protein
MVEAMRGLAGASPSCLLSARREVGSMPGMLIFVIGFFIVIVLGGIVALSR